MLIFFGARLVFLAVPKTGTTAIEGALAPRASLVLRDPPLLKHSNVARYNAVLKPFFEKAGGPPLETVAVVREPVDWLSSWYRYRHRDEIAGTPRSTRGMSFDDFVLGYAGENPPACANVGSQARFMLDARGARDVTHLFRYEQQPHLIAFFEQRLSCTIALSRMNVSPRMPLDLGRAARAALERARPEEFELWESSGR